MIFTQKKNAFKLPNQNKDMHSQRRLNLICSSKKWQAIGPDLALIPFDVPGLSCHD